MVSPTTLLRRLLIVALAVVFVPFGMMVVITPLVGMWGGGYIWTTGMTPDTGADWMWPLLWVAIVLIILGVGYVLFSGGRDSTNRETDPAIEALRVAYARGKLSDEEFDHRRERLQQEE